MEKCNCQGIGPSPQGVLRLNKRELLLREARGYTRGILLLFDCGGEEKMAQSDWHFPRARHGESGFVGRSK